MTTDPKDTRQKLLEIAGEVFAEEGFRLATVREICKRAHTNIAAINYHFGDKEKLYAEVFRYIHAFEACSQSMPHTTPIDPRVDPRGALAAFIDEMLSRMLNPGKFSWKGTLMAREMVEPSPVLDLIIELWMQPCWDRLKTITALIIDQPIDSEENHIAASSVMAQCFFHKHAGAVLHRLNPTFLYNEAQIQKLAQHLAAFAFGGLQALKTL
jgi:AcrR family transcriptional regulator